MKRRLCLGDVKAFRAAFLRLLDGWAAVNKDTAVLKKQPLYQATSQNWGSWVDKGQSVFPIQAQNDETRLTGINAVCQLGRGRLNLCKVLKSNVDVNNSFFSSVLFKDEGIFVAVVGVILLYVFFTKCFLLSVLNHQCSRVPRYRNRFVCNKQYKYW